MKSKRKVAVSLLIISRIKSFIRKKEIKKKNAKVKKTVWVKSWLEKRQQKGAYNNIMSELRFEDPSQFRRYLRMNADCYEVKLKR